jgi:acetyltransferase-like isoleucine patch superfamily enzyme
MKTGAELLAYAREQVIVYGKNFTNLSSRVGAGCHIGDDVFLGHGSIIGAGTWLSDGVKVWHYVNIISHAKIGMHSMVGSYVQLDPRVRIGRNVRIQPYSSLSSDTLVGDATFISLYVSFTDSRYPPTKRLDPIIVGRNVLIGSHVVILSGVVIGDNAVVDSGSLVSHSIPADEEWRGTPAKFYRTREKFDKQKALWVAGAD